MLKSSKLMSGVLSSAFVLTFVLVLVSLARAQNVTQASTDPDEVRALNAIFGQWNIKANTDQWNTTGDPCSGAAIDDTADFNNGIYNPFIKCDCSFTNRSVCHITQLKVYAMDVAGPIPDEIWTLQFLFNLNLGQNFLTGPLSPSIGNLTRMQYLSLGINALSGEVPKELGLLTEMLILSFSSNNFSGPLPSEIGSMSKLQQLYIDSAGVNGSIPLTFANLQNMQTLWASDNQFTGRIPDFIGNWSQLTTLRLQGNSLIGPIPSTFSNLTSLVELRLSDMLNMSSSLDFIRDMKSLTVLELRNNDMFTSIPSNIGDFQSLQQLDLSFNRLRGEIPNSLFNLSSLSSLFLGNNSLNGTIPLQKSSSLRTIDLSYNNLVGDIPSWANATNLQLNLVGNNFTLGSSANQAIFSRLNCLQKNFPCNRGAPRYAGFGVNSGGPPITSNENIMYEADNDRTLGAASHSVFSSERWGVSNVGLFTGNSNVSYTHFTSSQFANSLDPELFQTTRVSASSLRYYGLGLENGNYTVNLQFAEIDIENGRTWKSVGRRVFDVYLQGRLVLKDFDVRKEAGGASFRVVTRPFRGVAVSENYLEVHLFWAGKGTCCIPAQGTYGPSISAFSAIPEFEPTVNNQAPSTEKNKTGMIVGIVIGVCILAFAGLFAAFIIVRRRRRAQMYYDEEFMGMDVKPFTFSYSELKTATNDFNSANKLGEGGFGPVYKGTLEDGRVIAVKQLSVTSHQGKSQFVAEIATISAVQHRNLVKLYGCCLDGDKRLLVYEFLENNSLDQALFGKQRLYLDWPTRFEICLGVARGLTYLHEESRLRIVHRDVKSSNILLDSNLVPKISDFGLAKLYDDNKTHISTRVAGTIGYLAPEYAMRGHLTEKTDIFAFGVVALEIVSGRPNSDSSLDGEKMYLLEWAWNLHEQGHEVEVVDPELSKFDEEEVRRIIGVALLCTQTAPNARPSMSRVVAMLSGDADVSTEISRPGYLSDWKYSDTTTGFMTGIASQGTQSSLFDSSAGTSIVASEPAPPNTLPPSDSSGRPVLRDSITEGR